jgi:hypothetical protein
MSLCRRCALKWAQTHGLCRRCERETGVDERSVFERERDRIARRRRELESCQRATAAPRPFATRVIDGIEYEITWDGAVS